MMGVNLQSSKPHMDGIRRFMHSRKSGAVRARFETSYKKMRIPHLPFFKNTKVKIGFIVLGAGIVVLWIGGIIAQAEIARFYPAYCAGEWDSADAASGPPQVSDPSNPDEFTVANSAVLSGGKKTIACDQFAGDIVPEKILRVKLNLSWVFKPNNTPAPEPLPQPALPVSAEPSQELTPSAPEPLPQPALPVSAEPSQELTPSAPETEPVPAPEVQPQTLVPSETPVENPGPTTFRFIPILSAHAQENASAGVPTVSASLIFNGIENFLDVEYSLDGVQWDSVNNGDLEIPLVSMEDLKNLKLRMVSLRDDATLPDVYLDSLWLEIKYVPQAPAVTDTEAASSSVLDSVTSVLENIPSTISDVIQSGADAVTDLFTNSPVEVTNAPQTVETTVKPIEIKTISVKRFSLDSDTMADVGAVVERNGEVVRISGTCSASYVTLLLFRAEEDMISDPARAIVNHAYPCDGKNFSLLLEDSMIPSTLPDGPYLLFTGKQGSQGAWQKDGPLYSVLIQTISVMSP